MSRGRKKITTNGLDWEGLFNKSQGVYFQFILSELGKKTDFSITNDTGAELLEKIKAEKAQLIKAKKLKAEKDFPAIKPNEIPFEIPKNWVWCRLGEICNYGSSPKAEPKDLRDDTWVLDLEDIEKETSKLLNKVRFLERNSLSSKSMFKKGQILYSKLRPYLDKVIIADEDGVCTTEILPLEFFGQHNAQFILYALKRKDFIDYVNSVTKGMKMPRLGTNEGQMALFPLPALSEQERIVDFLQDFGNQSLIEDKAYFDSETEENVLELHESQLMGNQLSTELTHQLDLVKQLRQSFLREAMQGKLVAPTHDGETGQQLLAQIKAEKAQLIAAKKLKKEKDLPAIKAEDIPFEIPKHWTWCRLGEIALSSEAGKSFKCEEIPITGQEWGVIKVSAVSWDNFLEGQNKLYSKTQPDDIFAKIEVGDFLITRANTSELVGKSVVVKNISKNLLLSDKTIRFQFSPYVSTDYVNLCNNSKSARVYYAEMGTGSSPSMKNITRDQMRNLILPLPPLSEQQRIVEKLESLMQTCDALEASIKSSQVQNQQLLQQVLREALRK
jgi:type I restriction enzyme S subunit